MLLGQVLIKAGRFDEAVPQLKAAIALDPTASSLYYLLYQCYLTTGEKPLAQATLSEFKRVLSYYGEGLP
jgi:predicted Zn-dependent protease